MKKLYTLLTALLLCTFVWGESNYCGYPTSGDADYSKFRKSNKSVVFSWNTADNGDVVVTIAPGDDATTATFRDGGFGGDISKFTVLSGDGFATSEPASDYFYEIATIGTVDTYRLYRTGTNTLPSPCKIRFTGANVAWKVDDSNPYNSATFEYNYGTLCGSTLDAPTIYVSADGVVSFDAVTGADSYRAYVYLGGELVKECPVTSGQKVWNPYYDGDYAICVRSFNSALNTYSDFSNSAIWSAIGNPLGDKPKSQYCDLEMDRASNYPTVTNDQHSLIGFTWETLPNGNVLITLSEKDGGEPGTALFRQNGFDITKFYIDGVQNKDDNAIFETEASHTDLGYYTLKLKEGKSAPADRTHITYNGTVAYKTATSTNAWPTLDFDYTYGRNCDEVDDHVAPVVALTNVATTTTSVTLQIDVTEVNDFNETPALRSLTIRDEANDYVETTVNLDAENQITLSDLNKNTIYNFTVKAVDKGGNITEQSIEVPLIFDPKYNLALNKTCSAGGAEGGHGATYANDGDQDSFWGTYGCSSKEGFVNWQTTNTWEVDLGQAYVLDSIAIYTNAFSGNPAHTVMLKGKVHAEDDWFVIFDDLSVAANSSYRNIPAVASARFLQLIPSNNWMISIKEFEVYGHDYSTPDATNPEVTVTEVSSTINTVTLQIDATDKDDAGNDGTITAINISGDNDFVALNNITLDGSNQYTITGLTYNTTYTFTVYVFDLAGNEATQDIEVVLPFNKKLNLALNKTCSAGGAQSGHEASKANDGNQDTYWGTYGCSSKEGFVNWQTTNTWEVDLGAAYLLDSIALYTGGFDGKSAHTMTLRGKVHAEDDWFVIFNNLSVASNSSYRNVPAVAFAQYLQLKPSNDWMITIKEFEVYGSAFASPDETIPMVEVTEVSSTINTVTLQIDATDKDDAGHDGGITSINISGDNDFVTLNNITLNGSNQYTITGLTYNTTYTFTVHVFDLAGNETTQDVEVVLPFNTNLNLALNKPCTGGYCQFNNTTEEGRAGEYRQANDGNTGTSYSAYDAPSTDDAWWQVNLGASYNITTIKVNWAHDYSTGYVFYGSFDGTNWRPIGQDAATASGEKTTSLNASVQYIKLHSYNKKDIVIREVEVYASGFSLPDATNPEVTVTEVSSTINTVTLQIDATDKDDAGNDGIISAINISGDNDFVTLNNITLDESNQYTITGLTYNTTYTFTVHVFDLAGNETTQDVEVVLPFNAKFNLALNKTCSAGGEQNNDHAASKANDGKQNTNWGTYGCGSDPGFVNWQTTNTWEVDLEAAYSLDSVAIYTNGYNGHSAHIMTLKGKVHAEDDWFVIFDDLSVAAESSYRNVPAVATARYLQLIPSNNWMITIKEFEVYASGFAVEDNVAPVIETASCTTNTETATVTFTLAASDAVDGAISDFYISCANPVVAEAKYTVDGENQISISGLDVDKDYNFLIRCRDLSGNWASTNLVAHFSMASGTNVALGKTATAGRDEGGHTADNAFDGDEGTYWGCYPNTADVTTTWLRVDLSNAYKISNIVIKWEHFPDNGGVIIEGSLDGSDYSEIITCATKSAAETIDLTGAEAETPYRYLRIKAGNQNYFMSIYEFEVYASEELVFFTLGDATNNSTLITGHDDDQAIVTLNRSFEANTGNYTLVLPFDMTAEQCEAAFGAGYQLWYLSDSRIKENGDIYLNFVSISSIIAGRPYLFCPAADVASGAIISDVHIDATPAPSVTAQASFIGTYDMIPQATISTNENAYLLGGDNWLYAAQYSTWDLKALRAYFTLNFTPVNGVAPRIRVVYNESGAGVSTDLDPVTGNPSPVTQKLLRNGQLIIIRNGVEYNAQGQVIK